MPGVKRRHARQLVRRHLPGPGELLRQHRGRSRELPAASIPEFAAARRSRRRRGSPIGRARSSARDTGEAVRLEGRRPRPAPGHDLPPKPDGGLGVQHRRHLRRAEKGVDKTSSSSATTTSTRRPGAAATGDQVGWYVIKIDDPAQARGDGREARRDVRELAGRDQDRRPRRRSSPASRSRSATSARS